MQQLVRYMTCVAQTPSQSMGRCVLRVHSWLHGVYAHSMGMASLLHPPIMHRSVCSQTLTRTLRQLRARQHHEELRFVPASLGVLHSVASFRVAYPEAKMGIDMTAEVWGGFGFSLTPWRKAKLAYSVAPASEAP